MANEFKHKDPGSALTQAEFIASDGTGHIFDCQATGDIMYASSATVLKNLAKATDGNILELASGLPAWTASPTIGSTSWTNATHAHAACNSGGTVSANAVSGTTLKTCVVTSSLTTVAALGSGSIATGFGNIDNGSSTITTTGAITGGSLVADNFTLDGTELDLSSGDFTLDVAGDIAINADGGDITFADASLALAGIHNSSCVGELRIHEAANYVGFKAPALSANQIWTLPAADGSCGQVLSTNSSGVLSWATAGGADLGTANTWTADQTFNDNINLTFGTGGDADLDFDGSNLVLNPQVAGTGHFVINEGTIGGNAANAGTLNLNSTDAAFSGPIMVVHHNTASPADNDIPFRIYVRGPDGDCGTCNVTHAIIFQRCDVTKCTQDTSIRFDVANNSSCGTGAANTSATLTNAGVWTDASAAKDKEFEGDATTVWGSRVIDKLSTLNVGRYHRPCLPVGKTVIHHVSPTAEDLWEMFGIGDNPYTLNRDTNGDGVMDSPTPGIAGKDLAGLGLMAVQELVVEVNDIKSRLTAACIA